MTWQLDLLLLVLLLSCAVVAVIVRSMVATVAVLAAFSLFVALLFANMGAPDVAFVEAVLGSPSSASSSWWPCWSPIRLPVGPAVDLCCWPHLSSAAFAVLLIAASSDLPDRGDPNAPGHSGASRTYVEQSLDDSGTPNVVTAVLADYRSLDTLGETLVVFTAALAASLVLVRRPTT
jgi:multicomponent Na+:H+ antiporter subunit B